MKKLLSIFLAACLIITSGTLVFGAEDGDSFVIENLKTTVVDYYDNGLTNAYKPESTYISQNTLGESVPNGIILRAGGEWAKWSIDGITGGKYDISLEMESGYDTLGQIIVYVDDYMALVYQHTDLECKNDGKNQYRTHLLGSIEIPDGAETIKIKNDSLLTSALHLGKITLNKNDEAEKLPLTFATPILNKPDYYEKVNGAFQSSALPIAGEDYYIESSSYTYAKNYSNKLTSSDYPFATWRGGDWAKYNIEGLMPGRYKFMMNIGTHRDTVVSIEIDGVEKLESFPIPAHGLTVFKDVFVGEFSVDEYAKYLKISTSDSVWVRSFSLEMIPELEIVSVGGNIAPVDDVFARGTDSFTVNLNREFDKAQYEEIYIEDEDNNVLDCDVNVSGSKIYINLKETLDYSKKYCICMNPTDVAASEEGLESLYYEFVTDDETNNIGTASLENVVIEYKNETIFVSGVVKTSAKTGISGRNVELLIEKAGEEAAPAYNVVSKNDGAFEIEYCLPDSFEGGVYNAIVTSDYVEVDKREEFKFTYYTEEDEERIKNDLSNIKTLEDAEKMVSTYLPYSNVDEKDIQTMISDMTPIYSALLNREFDSAGAALSAICEAVYFECIAQSENEEDIVLILSNEEKSGNIKDFGFELWVLLSEEAKYGVANKIIEKDSSDKEKFVNDINEEIQKAYIQDKDISIPALSARADEINTGKTSIIRFALNGSAENVLKMYVELDYSEESINFFGSKEISIESDYLCEFENSVEERKFKIELKVPQENASEVSVDTLTGDIFTLNVFASGKAGGIHIPKINAYYLYHPNEIESKDINVKVPIESDIVEIVVNEITEKKINTQDIIEDKEGVGYHDNAGKNLEKATNSGENGIIIRNEEWVAYDISGLAAGKYELSVKYGCQNDMTFKVSVDGEIKGNGTLETTTSYLGREKVRSICNIEIDGEQSVLKVENSCSYSAYLWYFNLEKINPIKVSEVSSNVTEENGKLSRGADRFTISFNNKINKSSVNENNVYITDESGKKLDSQITLIDKDIFIDLKETLTFDKNYKLKVVNIEDKFGQILSDEYVWDFKTDVEENQEGLSGIKIKKWDVTDDKLTVEGIILSSGGVAISGRAIVVCGALAGEQKTLWQETVSGKDGTFKIEHLFESHDASGKYEVEISYEYAKEPYCADAFYFDENASNALASEFSGISSAEELENKLRENEEELGINLAETEEQIDISYIAGAMVNKDYQKAADVIDEFKKRTVLEKVNQADSADEIKAVIENSDELEIIGEIQRNKWDVLSETEKENISNTLLNLDRLSEPADLIAETDRAINNLLALKYDIKAVSVNVTSPTVEVGQFAVLDFTADRRESDVVGLYVEFEYTEAEAILFNKPTVLLNKALKQMNVVTKNENGKFTVELKIPQESNAEIKKISTLESLFSVSFKAESGLEGVYKPKVSGTIIYHKDVNNQTEDYFVDVPFVVNQPVVTINASKANTSSQGGSHSGGGGTFGGGKGTVAPSYGVEEYSKYEETEQKETDLFTDIDSVEWAKESINALAAKGIITGRGNGIFAPNDSVTRAEFSKMIVLAFGLNTDGKECNFTDVSENSWYYGYVAVAKSAGIINGKDDGSFDPDGTITREDMATMAYRALALQGNSENVREKFDDDAQIADYAKKSVYALKALGVINGVGDNNFAPKTYVTRAMAAKVIYMLTNV